MRFPALFALLVFSGEPKPVTLTVAGSFGQLTATRKPYALLFVVWFLGLVFAPHR